MIIFEKKLLRICMQEEPRIYKTTSEFWDYFNNLPDAVQKRAKRKFELFKRNPSHPSLEFKKLATGYWRVKIGDGYRALAFEHEESLYWFWIGNHKTYERIIRK